jgi:penicillin-binding protein 1A
MTEPVQPGDSGGFSARSGRGRLLDRPWQWALIGLFGLVTAGMLLVAFLALLLAPTLPSVDDLAEKRLKVPMRVYTADGQLIAEFGEEKRIPVKIDEVPDLLVKAILAAEDHSFLYHHGVDFLGILRATWHNLRSGTPSQGGSTITMQVARNYFLSPEKTYTRKLKEVLLAFKIERELTKKEILELYVNKIFLGHRAYGFAAAAQIYYGKSLADLTPHEMAMLAGLPKAPSRDNPLSNPDNALERRDYVLRHMHKLGFIDEALLNEALNAPLTASRHAIRYDVDASYIAEMVRQELFKRYDEKTYAGGFHVYTTLSAKHQRAANTALRKGLLEYERRHGYRGPAGHVAHRGEIDKGKLDDVLKDFRIVGGLVPGIVLKVEEKSATVYTQDGSSAELDWGGLSWARKYVDENAVGPAPKKAADILRPGDIVYLEHREPRETDEETGGLWRLAQIPQVAGAVVALRPGDGAILALAGGFDFYHSSFNRVTQAERQPGSSMKPFIWAAALEKGFTPASTVSGAPIVIEDATLEEEWRPEDYSKKFFGPTRLRKALALSLNLVSVRLLRAIGPTYTVGYLEERFGFDGAKLPRNLSLALGTASATPLQMASAFTVFANGGYRIEPYFITRIEDAEHSILEQAQPYVVCPDCPAASAKPADEKPGNNPGPKIAERKLSPEISFLMTSMMKDVIREGTGRGALALNRKDLAGKTGTTNEYRDAWFSGFNSDLAATAWIGFDQPAPLGRAETGGRAALPIWIEYMRIALEDTPEKPLIPPEGIVKFTVNSETGKLTEPGDPEAMEEFFVKGSETESGLPGTDEAPLPGGPENIPENVREKLF